MDEKIRKKIENIIGDTQCPKDFRCAKDGFERLCKARECGMTNYLECLEPHSLCKFVMSFGNTYFCRCPLRVYIAKNLGK